jgi:hypothetical protein
MRTILPRGSTTLGDGDDVIHETLAVVGRVLSGC